jgi:hypothetical protein
MEWARSTEFKTPALPENKDQKGWEGGSRGGVIA